jgi:[methyl-Co(III) methanol-specific corrinoid protein]:coenzyme M methyltransferase
MNHIGVYFPDAHKDPRKMAKLSLATYRNTGIECVGVPFDLTVEAELLGGVVLWENKKDYIPTAKPSSDLTAFLEQLRCPADVSNIGRVPVVLEALEIINRELSDPLPVAAGITGPFTMAGSLIGAEKFFEWLFTDPDRIVDVMKICTATLVKYVSLIQEENPDVIAVCEPMASGTLINSELFERFVSSSIKKIVECSKPPIMLHICGKSTSLVKHVMDTGSKMFSFDENVDIDVAKKTAQDNLLLVGNISPARTLLLGTEDDVVKETLAALEKGIDILAPGCGIPAKTPNKNLLAMTKTAKVYRKKN